MIKRCLSNDQQIVQFNVWEISTLTNLEYSIVFKNSKYQIFHKITHNTYRSQTISYKLLKLIDQQNRSSKINAQCLQIILQSETINKLYYLSSMINKHRISIYEIIYMKMYIYYFIFLVKCSL